MCVCVYVFGALDVDGSKKRVSHLSAKRRILSVLDHVLLWRSLCNSVFQKRLFTSSYVNLFCVPVQGFSLRVGPVVSLITVILSSCRTKGLI